MTTQSYPLASAPCVRTNHLKSLAVTATDRADAKKASSFYPERRKAMNRRATRYFHSSTDAREAAAIANEPGPLKATHYAVAATTEPVMAFTVAWGCMTSADRRDLLAVLASLNPRHKGALIAWLAGIGPERNDMRRMAYETWQYD